MAVRTRARALSLTAAAPSAIAIASACGIGALGCAGGSPLLHPARTLPRGDIRAQAGMSAQFAGGDLASAIAGAREQASRQPAGLAAGTGGTGGTGSADPVYARGALVAAAVAPGIAPFAAARVGVGASFEGGLGYTGRSVRLDLRRSFALSDATDLSIGAGASAPLYGRDAGSLPNVDLSRLRGYGADLPVLVGWESAAGLYRLWAGARGGFEHVSIENVSSDPRPGVTDGGIPLDANRFWLGAVAGLAVGFRSLHVALELQAASINVSGSYDGTSQTVSGFSLTPATALGWDF